MRSNTSEGLQPDEDGPVVAERVAQMADADGYPIHPGGNPENIRYCTRLRSDSKPCHGRALVGMDVCFYHGGASAGPKVRTVKRIQFGANALTAAYGAPHEVAPAEALLQEVWRTNGHVLWLQERILTANPDHFAHLMWSQAEALTAGTTSQPVRPEEVEAFPDAYTAVWHQLYMKERTHLVTVAREAIRADATGALQRLSDAQGMLFAAVLHQLFDKLDLSGAQRTVVGQVLPELMQSLVTGEVVSEDDES
jgi:hypothetical protein